MLERVLWARRPARMATRTPLVPLLRVPAGAGLGCLRSCRDRGGWPAPAAADSARTFSAPPYILQVYLRTCCATAVGLRASPTRPRCSCSAVCKRTEGVSHQVVMKLVVFRQPSLLSTLISDQTFSARQMGQPMKRNVSRAVIRPCSSCCRPHATCTK